MPGWLVGFSLTASMISAMTFVAIPGFSFKEDYRWVLPSFSFLFMAVFAMVVLVPFFRRVQTPSGYAFLEMRFGVWARMYAAVSFLLFKLLRLGIVLYVTSMSLEVFLGVPAVVMMLIIGVVATIYTMIGGFEAVVWTEFIQAIILIAGALLIVPAALHFIPGGLGEVFELAVPAGKTSFGRTDFTFVEKTMWVMIIASLFTNASDYATRQDFIQRYRAASTATQARIALAVAAFTVVPIWLYFNLLGTVLWAFYKINPDPIVAEFAMREPEKIVPYFISTHLPPGVAGLVLAAILMASLSAMAPILNASAVTWVSDFHERFIARGRSEAYYLKVGRVSTGIFGVVMIVLALAIHAMRTQTLQDLQAVGSMIFSAGLFGLFIIGFFGHRVDSRSALIASLITVGVVCVWVALGADAVLARWPGVALWLPDRFWIPVVSNLMLPALAFALARRRSATAGVA